MDKTVASIMAGLTLEEKASLCSGRDFWFTKSIPGKGVEGARLTDGPHGLRKQTSSSASDNLQASVPATCFPSGAGMAASWNPALVEEIGRAMGEEAAGESLCLILGPALNIKRSPLCGRNFEYYSEDPLLSGKTAAALVRGIQSAGVGACPKHFAVNNQERLRTSIDARLDERTLREIYLPGFEIAVKEGKPWTVMCAYNKVNGTYCAQNRFLLTDVLRGEWGFDGAVVTDWGADDDRVEGLEAGQDLEMPGNGGVTDADIVKAVRSGSLSMEVLDLAAERLIALALRMERTAEKRPAKADLAAHHALARRAASECAVLLKNEGALPLGRNARIAFLGAMAETPRYQGGGSSRIEPAKLDNAIEEARKLLAPGGRIDYAPGYSLAGDAVDAALIANASRTAADADSVVVFAGLPPEFESEGFDRKDLALPAGHVALIEAAVASGKDVVVVLSNGSALEMPWLRYVNAVLESYLGGQAWGGGIADLLFGIANPSGKLPETFPERLEDVPCAAYFPGGSRIVEYREGVFAGYRHYDTAGRKPLFPFGHGLSYASFEYGEPFIGAKEIVAGESLSFSIRVRNASGRGGAETVQAYVRDVESSIPKPFQELRAFKKVFIEAGAEAVLEFMLDARAFSHWDETAHDWRIEPGTFEIRIGSSSRDIRRVFTVEVRPRAGERRTWDQNARYFELAETAAGRAFMAEVDPVFKAQADVYAPGSPERLMTLANQREFPLRNIVRMMGGKVSPERLDKLLKDLNAEHE